MPLFLLDDLLIWSRSVCFCQLRLDFSGFFSALKLLKFIYCKIATKFCEISTLELNITTSDNGGDFEKFVAFSEYMNY